MLVTCMLWGWVSRGLSVLFFVGGYVTRVGRQFFFLFFFWSMLKLIFWGCCSGGAFTTGMFFTVFD
ncbi:hypothetical protein L873DRAFT_1298830 [Choiromyces venosus 120613-1]|uniref:Uncharacterized protein n=1 Tax=Choiromyces venosus 120613-1 TaxID=1336337 RepID=A0A3N4JH53_9PEZI|nr:hypothetical protein L873DRAFT_1298830 [Choiromyces venosus 120613-1]